MIIRNLYHATFHDILNSGLIKFRHGIWIGLSKRAVNLGNAGSLATADTCFKGIDKS